MAKRARSTTRLAKFTSTPYRLPSCAPLNDESFHGFTVSSSMKFTMSRSSSSVIKFSSKKCPESGTFASRFAARVISANASCEARSSSSSPLPSSRRRRRARSNQPPSNASLGAYPVVVFPVCARRPRCSITRGSDARAFSARSRISFVSVVVFLVVTASSSPTAHPSRWSLIENNATCFEHVGHRTNLDADVDGSPPRAPPPRRAFVASASNASRIARASRASLTPSNAARRAHSTQKDDGG
mmetsp:Transcript_1039/g.3826  ORF Transcript_1039/g.3826 Transcript_1039/m.3826 type:complete len:243 (+) Transcript_1039:449-1177(+)